MSGGLRLKLALLDNIIWLMLAAFFVLCALAIPNFSSWNNLVNILYHTTIMSML
ncbi:MAG: ABC transporter permease, partial [Synergistales bacterium]|nr:ABC transporter permease [Synergistales bacterium]